MKHVTLLSPAKLNLALKVVNKRNDGYHNLVTLFERINLCDTLRFTCTPGDAIKIICNDSQVPLGPKNIVYRVARVLKEHYGIKQGVSIQITKRIPVAAGLAGGSSNAATAIEGLSRLWRIPMSHKEKVFLGKAMGSDVPFFLYDCSWGLGKERGDAITRLNIPANLWHILVVPRLKMYSREVFTHFKMKLTKDVYDVNILIRSLKKNNIFRVKRLLFNDLEQSILGLQPSLLKVKNRLKDILFEGVEFSGSGPSVFGIVMSKSEAEQIKAVLSKRYTRVFVVKTL